MERSTEEALHAYEQEEVRKALGCGYVKENDDDPMGSVVVSKLSTSLTNWLSRCSQSPLPELPNERRNCQRKRCRYFREPPPILWPEHSASPPCQRYLYKK